MTADVRRSPRRGTSSRVRHKAHAPHAGTKLVACVRGTRPSLGPSTRARRSSLHTAASKASFVVGRSVRHHGWANPRKWEEPTLGSDGRTWRGSPRVTALAREKAWHVEKRKEVEASVPARIKSPGWVARTSCFKLQKSVGDVWPRISSANALQKGRSGSSERGPSSE